MKYPFREYHLFQLLSEYEAAQLPMDVSIHNYFRTHKALGSGDRRFIAETAYGMLRWKGLLEALTTQCDWPGLFAAWRSLDSRSSEELKKLPLATQVSCPQILWDWLCNSHGEARAEELCRASNTQAPTTIRANRMKTDRDTLLKRLAHEHDVEACPDSPSGIRFRQRANFFQLPEFKEGLFEVQDAGSQLLADLVAAEPGQKVLDFCAGSGGKTLAFAHRLCGQGQIYLHDVRRHALYEARKRLKRAGIQNAQLLWEDAPQHSKLKKKMDWVLVDAPCSGTGTLRRNPDMKWRYTEATLRDLCALQR
ncbi:MAG: RsmB/NOP family class I SAM-dependent RNA methyltransferase, partial [Chlamydiia bacterium]|nr:RsmB/NOP family class I SAM-dependent RNA methyltransferase [Chlamydiia bacterium]